MNKTFILLFWIANLASAATPWSQYHGSAAHEGRWNGNVNLSAVSLLWTAGTDLLRSSEPAVSADGSTVFAFGETTSGQGKIYAFNTKTGNQIWSVTVKSYTAYLSWSSPIYYDGYVYWAGGSNPFTIYKINAVTGLVEWSQSYTGSIVNASPTIGGNKLYISTYGGYSANSVHYAINITDGSVAWTATSGGSGQGAMPYDAGRNRVYQTILLNKKHTLQAYDANTGSIVWTADWSSTNSSMQCGIAYVNNRIYFQDYNFSGNGNLYVADAANNGDLLWATATPASGDSCPAIALDGSVFAFGNYTGAGNTRGYDSTGSILWTFTQAGGWTGTPAWADGYVFAGDQTENYFYLLNDKTGQIEMTLTGSGPASFGLNTLYTIGTDGVLYAYRLSYLPGDATGDDAVDVGDLGILAANYGSSNKNWNEGDFTGDGVVDVGDLGILAANYGTGTSGADFNADYAKIFESNDAETESTDSFCSSLGLSLILALSFAGFMLTRLEQGQ